MDLSCFGVSRVLVGSQLNWE